VEAEGGRLSSHRARHATSTRQSSHAIAGERSTYRRRPPPLRMLWITAAFGACFLAVRWGLRDAPLLWFAALRALLAGLALLLVACLQRRRFPRSVTAWARLTVLGLVNVSLAFWAMFAGIAGLATGTAAVLANAQPLLIVLPAWWICGERISVRTGLALLVGFGGLILVAVPGGGGQGALLSLLAALAVTAGTLLARHLGEVDVVVASALHLLIGGAVLVAAALVVEGPATIAWTPRFLSILTFLGLVGTAATTLAWFVETQRCPLSSLTPWMFLVPVFGLLIGVVVLAERPNPWTVAGSGLVLLSMWVALGHHSMTGAVPGRLHIPDSTTLSTSRAERGARKSR
jgi:probable blue pigment (indigoidine) exporter